MKEKISRREFIKAAGGISLAAGSVLLGASAYQSIQGENLPDFYPYLTEEPASRETKQSHIPISPLLVLNNERSPNPFGIYLSEILRAEGLNCFFQDGVSTLQDTDFSNYDLVILCEGPIDQIQQEVLENYLQSGGRLIAMRPDSRLCHLFGIQETTETESDGYLQAEGSHLACQGILKEIFQYHGPANLYQANGAEAVAWLLAQQDKRPLAPAITIYQFGGGLAAAWAFDLAKSIVYTRQGNPAWANHERDDVEGVRACDMFAGWLDLERIAIPQADEQQRLLVNLIQFMCQGKKPLPRLWYFPGSAEGAIIATGDAHGNPAPSVEEVISRVEKFGGHVSIYYTPAMNTTISRAARRIRSWLADLPLIGNQFTKWFTSPTSSQIARWRSRGHEFTLHPYVEGGLVSGWKRCWKEFTGIGYGPVSPTVRTHRVLWSGWTETASVQSAYGILMNMDYYHYGPTFQKDSGEWVYGYFTGSGLPMRFIDEEGQIINIYQQATQLVDEQLIKMPWGDEWEKLDVEAAINISKKMIDRTLNGYYGAIATQFHVDPYFFGGEYANDAASWLEGTLKYAMDQGLPIYSSADWQKFVDIRHNAILENMSWKSSGNLLSFKLVAQSSPGVDLALMLPIDFVDSQLRNIKVDGESVEYSIRDMNGVSYGWVSISSGIHFFEAEY